MRLTDEERAMLTGEQGPVRQWAMRHQIAVGEFFDAPDFVAVGQAHVMADTESLGEAGVEGVQHAGQLQRAQAVVEGGFNDGHVISFLLVDNVLRVQIACSW
jgi:hypothetical protein